MAAGDAEIVGPSPNESESSIPRPWLEFFLSEGERAAHSVQAASAASGDIGRIRAALAAFPGGVRGTQPFSTQPLVPTSNTIPTSLPVTETLIGFSSSGVGAGGVSGTQPLPTQPLVPTSNTIPTSLPETETLIGSSSLRANLYGQSAQYTDGGDYSNDAANTRLRKPIILSDASNDSIPAAVIIAKVQQLRQSLRASLEQYLVEQERLVDMVFSVLDASPEQNACESRAAPVRLFPVAFSAGGEEQTRGLQATPPTQSVKSSTREPKDLSAMTRRDNILTKEKSHRSSRYDGNGSGRSQILMPHLNESNELDQEVNVLKKRHLRLTDQDLKRNVTGSSTGTPPTAQVGFASMGVDFVAAEYRRSAWIRTAATWADWFMALHEPPRSGCLAKVVASPLFEAASLTVIMLNGIFVFFTSNYSVQHLQEEHPGNVRAVEGLFLAFYTIELLLKIAVHREYFFCNEEMRWNIGDTVLVLLGWLEIIADSFLHANSLNVAFIRSMRVLKISKVFRMFRVLRFFPELRLILDCLLGSFTSLFWACVLMLFFDVIFSMIFVQGIAQYLMVHSETTEEEKNEMLHYFGSVQEGVLTLFHSTTGGDWEEPIVQIRKSGLIYFWAFIFYIVFYNVAFINIVTSIFIERAMQLAKPNVEMMMLEKRREDILVARDLLKVLEMLDIDTNGCINQKEFSQLMDNFRVADYFEHHGLDVKDAEMLFRIMVASVESDEVDICLLIDGLLRMRGPASSLDLITTLFEMRLFQASNVEFQHRFQEQMDYIMLCIDSQHNEGSRR